MAEETTQAERAEEQTEEQTETGETPEESQGGETQAGQTDVQGELEQLRVALKKANSEAAERRHKLQEYEEAERKRQEAELSEVEKLRKRLDESAAEREHLTSALNETRIRHAIEMTAAKMRFHDPADAYALSDLTGVDIDEDGAVSGVEDALKALAKAKPHLIRSAEPAANLNAQNRTNGAASMSEDDAQRIAAIYGVRPEYVKSAVKKRR